MTKRLLCIMLWLLTMLTISARDFSHPGGMLSQTDLNRIKTHVEAGDEPWASLWKEFQNCSYAKATYTASPNTEVGGSDGNRQRAAGDAYAALLNAIEWHVTGETKYADCAAKILTAWGNKITSAKDELFQYPCRAFITAAEMLRTADGFYTGWDETDRNTFLNKVRTVMVPACRQFCTYQGTHPSWFTPCALAVLGAGVLLDDEDLYNEGYALMMNTEHWGTMYGGSIEPYGQVREMGRDNVHGQLTFCDIALACMFAWNQGDDMFGEGDNRLLRGMNYWCRYNTGHTDTPFEMTNNDGLDYTTGYSSYYISTHNNGFRLRPSCYSFEAVYHHYREVKGISDDDDDMRYLALAAKLARPDSNTEMLGFGTLLFTIDPNTSEYMTEVPERPAHVNAEPCYGGIRISWQHPEQEDARGFRIYRSSNGDLFQNIVEWDYYTNNEYIDDTAEEGKTYYYKVRFINKAGLSEYSDAVTATRLAADESLPEGWTYVGLGSSTGGSGAYIDVQDSTFIVNGIGSDIGGTNDQCGFIYKQMKTKNFTFTARLASTDESYWKVGIMVRSSVTNAGSQRVGLTLGESGCRMLRMCTRSTNGANTTWVNGTNFGHAPLWMRIKRDNNTFYTYVSRDGENWHEVSHTSIAMSTTTYVGMAACTHNSSGDTYQAAFDHVSLDNPSTTGISDKAIVDCEESATAPVYDLQGRRIENSRLAKGFYISRGRKVVL